MEPTWIPLTVNRVNLLELTAKYQPPEKCRTHSQQANCRTQNKRHRGIPAWSTSGDGGLQLGTWARLCPSQRRHDRGPTERETEGKNQTERVGEIWTGG